MLLASLGAFGYMLVEAEQDSQTWSFWLNIALQFGLMILAAKYCRNSSVHLNSSPVIIPLLVMVMVGSYVYETIERWVYGTGHPFEFLVTCSLKNVVLAMAATACWPRYQSLTVIGSLFLMLFSLTISPQPVIILLTVIYGLVAVIWLMSAYWEKLKEQIQDRNIKERTPSRWIYAFMLVGLLVSGWFIRDHHVLHSLRGFMPSSGGNEDSDPYARNGIGDGEMLVAGTDNIQSFAPIEDAPFKTSDEPSLYDLFDDSYQEKLCPIHKKSERAIGLAPQLSKRVEEELAKSQKVSRAFSTLRQESTKSRAQPMKSLTDPALFFVAGRTPLHLRMEVYDLFDGVNWHPLPKEEPTNHGYPIMEKHDRPWLMIKPSSGAYELCYQTEEKHALKIINLRSRWIPAPLGLRGLHIDQLTQPDFYVRGPGELMGLDRAELPELLPIHLSSMALDPNLIRSEKLVAIKRGSDSYNIIPEIAELQMIHALTQEITVNHPPGWQQIDAVIDYLRTRFLHNRQALQSNVDSIPVTEFFQKTRAGPDYLFATSAALMLRSLGYSTRVVSGFYVSPEKYDRKLRQTPVHKDDVHFWVEILVGANIWTTLEPTPGYEILCPPPTGWQRALSFCHQLVGQLQKHYLSILLCLIVIAACYFCRVQILNQAMTFWWWVKLSNDPRQQILSTFHLLEYRFKSAGMGRNLSETADHWLVRIAQLDGKKRDDVHLLTRLVNWAAFAPMHEDQPPQSSLIDIQYFISKQTKYWKLSTIRSLLRR
jgi:hypothetical protein